MEGRAIGGRLARAYAWLVVGLAPLVVAACVAGAVAAHAFLPSLSTAQPASMSALLPQRASALRTQKLAVRLFRFPLLTPFVVVQRNPSGLSAAAVADAYAIAARVTTHHPRALSRLALAAPIVNTLGLFPGSREHGTTAVTYLFFRGDATRDAGADDAVAQRYARLFSPADHVVGVSGALPARIEQYSLIESHLRWVEGATVLVILAILAVSLRAVIAPLLTIAAAGLAFVVSQRILGWLAVDGSLRMPRELTAVAVALMLGVVTDYSVLFFTGTRRRLAAGEGRFAAVRGSVGTFASIALVAGLVVCAGVATLSLGTLGFFRSFGPGMAITVLAGLAMSITFVPAALALLGPWAFWPGLRHDVRSAGGSRWIVRLLRHRIVAALVALVVLAALAAAASGLGATRLGLALVRGLPANDKVEQAGAAAGHGFAPGILAPTELLLRMPGVGTRRRELASLQSELAREPHVAAVLGPAQQPLARRFGLFLTPRGGAARFAIVFDAEPTDAPAIDALKRVEADAPRLLARARLAGAHVDWGGETALGVEADRAIVTSAWRIAIAALLVNLLFLAVFLRALVAPLYILVASAAGLAATFGVTTYLFQDVLGFGGLTYYLPIAIGVLLVSLGSDYDLFVVGRIWQEAKERPIVEAVDVAAPRASRAIGIAGLAMAASFALLAIVPLQPFRVFAFAMAFGILLDALLVRAVLVPSLIVAFGRFGFLPRRAISPGGSTP